MKPIYTLLFPNVKKNNNNRRSFPFPHIFREKNSFWGFSRDLKNSMIELKWGVDDVLLRFYNESKTNGPLCSMKLLAPSFLIEPKWPFSPIDLSLSLSLSLSLFFSSCFFNLFLCALMAGIGSRGREKKKEKIIKLGKYLFLHYKLQPPLWFLLQKNKKLKKKSTFSFS